MKFNDAIFEDLSRVASGVASVLTGLREQFDARTARAGSPDSVSREEFEVVRDMAAKAREMNEELARRIAVLEALQGTPKA
jgi:BMFP domain-containing protein YqiC